MSSEPRAAAVVPWLLEPGADYLARIGPDADGEGRIDGAAEETRVRFEHRGQEVHFRFPGRTQYAVEIRRASALASPSAAADLALSEQDVRFVAEYARVDVTVHNVDS